MPKVVTIKQMRDIEAAADAAGHSYDAMMDLAGRAVADRILVRIASTLQEHLEARVLVLVGPGNNGGDGLVAARYLKEERQEIEVLAYLLKSRSDAVFERAEAAGVETILQTEDKKNKKLAEAVSGADIIVDGLFGTGSRLPIKGAAAEVLERVASYLSGVKAQRMSPQYVVPTDPTMEAAPIKHSNRPYIIAVDCPSGVDCDTGDCDPLTLAVDETITFAAAKPGLLTFPGADLSGLLVVADIGVPDDLEALASVDVELSSAQMVGSVLPARPRNSHKGTFGKVFLAAGSLNFTGAAYLAAAAAYRVGAGLVTVGAPGSILPVLAGLLPEATWIYLPHDLGVINRAATEVVRSKSSGYSALLLGPGIGNEDETREFVEALLGPREVAKRAVPRFGLSNLIDDREAGNKVTEKEALPPLVIDADGLNVLAQLEDWHSLMPPATVITPHPAEFARLSGLEREEINVNRVQIAHQKSIEWNVIVVLKGAFTVVAAPDGRIVVSPFASASLASAGSGDVLAGVIAGLVAQGLQPFEAAWAGVWLHGFAGSYNRPDQGNLASDILDGLAGAMYHADLSE